MNLFQLGHFTLNSGRKSRLKLECDALTTEDWEAIAYLVSRLVGPFGSVEGVPRGGLKLAECLQPYTVLGTGNHPHLIVDDVLTTGGSMERVRQAYLDAQPMLFKQNGLCGAVVFARGPLLPWVQAVCPLPRELWEV